MNNRGRRTMTGPSGQKFGVSITGYTVGSWCPTPDGSGPPEAVALELETKLNGQEVSMFMRLKSPQAVDDMVQALMSHKRHVWPDDCLTGDAAHRHSGE